MNMTFKSFLTTQNTVVAHNVKINNLKVKGGILHGAWIQDRPNARVEVVSRSATKLSFQLQAKCAHWDRQALKVVKVTLEQVGQDVVARADWAAYTTSDHAYGYDLSDIVLRESPNTDDEGRAPIATSAWSEGFGVAELLLSLSSPKPILVDGSNIALHFPNLRSKALAHLLECLRAKGYEPTVLFDASIRYKLKERNDSFGLVLVERLLSEDGEHAQLVPAGTICDDYLLLLADQCGWPIVTCDTFKNQNERYVKRYPWLKNRVESGKKRVHAPAFVLGKLLIPTLGIAWSCKDSIAGSVFIQAYSNGKYLCADCIEQAADRPIRANRSVASDWETFVAIENSDGTVSFKSKANGKFISTEVDSGGILNARADKIDAWEKFWLTRRNKENGGHYILRSCANKKYVTVDRDTGLVAALVDVADEWEWLEVVPCA